MHHIVAIPGAAYGLTRATGAAREIAFHLTRSVAPMRFRTSGTSLKA